MSLQICAVIINTLKHREIQLKLSKPMNTLKYREIQLKLSNRAYESTSTVSGSPQSTSHSPASVVQTAFCLAMARRKIFSPIRAEFTCGNAQNY